MAVFVSSVMIICFKFLFVDRLGPTATFHKANFDHDNDQSWVKTKQLVGRISVETHNRFAFCVVEFAVNGKQA